MHGYSLAELAIWYTVSIAEMLTVAEIAAQLGGELIGDGSGTIAGISSLESASSTDLSFFAPTTKRKTAELLELAKSSQAGAILVVQAELLISRPQIVVSNPLGALIQLAPRFVRRESSPGVHPTAVVDPSAAVATSASIGPFVVVGPRSVIGEDVIIHPHVVIYHDVKVGDKSVIHSGAVIREGVVLGEDCLIQNGVVVGGDGFGYVPDKAMGHRRIPHLGNVVLEDRVDIGANSTIDRGTFGETRIGKGTKVDNLVMIAHNVRVGEASLLCGQVGISGSSTIGSQVILAGQVGVADHASIGDRVRAAAKTGISGEVPDGVDVAGYPHQEASKWRRTQVALRYLPELFKRRQQR